MTTYSIDTNVILRYLRRDNIRQTEKALFLFREAKQRKCLCYLSVFLFVEAVSVLVKLYRVSKKEVSETLLSLVDLPYLVIEKKDVVRTALEWFPSTSVSFIDLLLAVEAKQTGKTLVTFDKKLKRVVTIFPVVQ